MHQNNEPGRAARLSWVTSDTSVAVASPDGSWTTSSTSVASRRSCRRTGSSRYGTEEDTLPVASRDESLEAVVGSIATVGGQCSWRSAACMILENTGAATAPPSILVFGSSSTTTAANRGDSAGANPAKLAM